VYSIGGWIIIAGWRSSGLRPTPSAGGDASVSNGFSQPTISSRKNAAIDPSTAVAQGAMSRSERRVRNSTAVEKSERSVAQRRSDPSWVAHRAVIL
jgi:hypothetical protein